VSNRAVAKPAGARGFSLLELMVVVAILAGVAFIAGGAMSGVREQSAEQMVYSEMQQIAAAIRQFRQDTGYYPKTGPFNLDTATGGAVTDAILAADFLHSGSSAAERQNWFYSPANFYQLYTRTSPLHGTGHQLGRQLENWDAETGRGWRGPYLTGFVEGYLDIGDGINSASPAGNSSGDPLGGTNITDVEGIADPFEHRPVASLLVWRDASSTATPPGVNRAVWGRPYLLFGLDSKPRLICMGPDGRYGTTDDIELLIE
jgi:prepilin-type N-terminal cleavage/methylation domain-containing protein